MAQVYRCSYESTRRGVKIVNTFHVVARQVGGETGPSSADSVRDALHAALTTKYRALLDAVATVDDLLVREELDPSSGGIPAQSLQSIGLAGTRALATAELPPSACIVATFVTNAAVRSGRGRMWYSILDKDNIGATGLVVQAGVCWTNLAAYLDELKTIHHVTGTLGGWDLAQVIYSRTRRARGDANYWFDVTGYVRRPTVHWLESRATAP